METISFKPKKPYKPQSHIYLLRVGEGWRPIYKIGSSSDPAKRRRQISAELKVPVVLVAEYEIGGRAAGLETAWHRFFRPVAIKPHPGSHMREWFHFTERNIRLFKHLSYWVSKRIQVDRETDWYDVFNYSDMDALRARFKFNPS